MNDLELNKLNTNKYFIGIIVIILTIGGRFIIGELDEYQKTTLMDNVLCRRIIIFCAFFMGTRDIIISIALTLIFSLMMNIFTSDNKTLKNINNDENKKEEIKSLIKRLNELND